MREPTMTDYLQMMYNASCCVEQRITEANQDGNTDVGVSETGVRDWLAIVWNEWRKQVWRERIEQASAKAWDAPERIEALVKHEPGGQHD